MFLPKYKIDFFKFCIVIFLVQFFACNYSAKTIPSEKYIFFLHNRFLEGHALEEAHPEYGKVEYRKMLNAFEANGFTMMSEIRDGNVNAHSYAQTQVILIDSLMELGISPNNITVVGTSKGGYIAQYISTLANNPNLNFVFIASFQNDDIENASQINWCGNILNIYEKSDPYGVSAEARMTTSNCTFRHFENFELNTGLGHGIVFRAMDEWLNPTMEWANGNFDAKGFDGK